MPATASTSPCAAASPRRRRGGRRARSTAACSTGERDRRAHRRRLARARCAEHARRRRRSSPPGVPSRRSSKIRSRPLTPTWASAGTPSASSASRRSGGIGPSCPTTAARQPRVEVRSSPRASSVLSRARSVARGGSRSCGASARRGAGPGTRARATSRRRRRAWSARRPSPRDGAEGARGDADRACGRRSPSLARLAGDDRVRRRRAQRVAGRRAANARAARGRARRRELAVHRRVVAALPRPSRSARPRCSPASRGARRRPSRPRTRARRAGDDGARARRRRRAAARRSLPAGRCDRSPGRAPAGLGCFHVARRVACADRP